MNRRVFAAGLLASAAINGRKAAAAALSVHGLWVWRTIDLIADMASLTRFIQQATAIHVANAYLYLNASDYRIYERQIEYAVYAMNLAGISVWSLQGERSYFHDASGPGELDAVADALMSFNANRPTQSRLSGLVLDLEPQDGQDPDAPAHFHNGLADSELDAHQAADRRALMGDWVGIHRKLRQTMAEAGLRLAGAFPAWTCGYQGEAVAADIDGQHQDVAQALMASVDVCIVMSYRTDPRRSIALLRPFLAQAAALGSRAPPVVGALETHAGPGRDVSYGDDPAKRTKYDVLADLRIIDATLRGDRNFGGIDLHDWAGWSSLP